MLSTISPSVTALAVGPPAQRAIAQRFSAMARCCRSAVLQQVGSYLAYIGRGANPFERAAHDPKLTSSSQVIPDGFEPSYWIERREQALLVADWQFHATSDDVCDPAGIASSLDDNVCDQVWITNLA